MARILVIDDTKNIRKMVRLALEHDGHEVAVAEDGLQGLQVFGNGTNWDVVLLDERMPGIAGHEVLEEIKLLQPAACVVMITAFATLALAANVIAAGVSDFLRKPFSTEALRGAVQGALQPLGVTEAASGTVSLTEAFPYRINGFQFQQAEPLGGDKVPPALEVQQTFVVQGPEGRSRCIVGLTPLACKSAREKMQNGLSEEVWGVLCRSALSNYLWDNSKLPPAVLPIFELSSSQIYDLDSLADTGP